MTKKKNEIEQLIQDNHITNMNDINSYITKLKGQIITSMLEGELTHHLEYEKNEKRNNVNSRNGYSSKNREIETSHGIISIDMPRDRNGSFEPILVPKRKRILEEIDDSIILMYAKGMSQRDIRDIVKNAYGIDISSSFISSIVDQVSNDVSKWQNRKLKKIYPFVYIDCLYVNIKEEYISKKKAIYVMIGIDITGHKEVMGLWVGSEESEGAYYWNQILSEIKERGVEEILFISMDGLSGLKETIEEIYPKTVTQRCVVHLVRNLYKKCKKKEAKTIICDFKKIYQSATLEQAKEELENFKNKHKEKTYIIKALEEYMEYILSLYEYPEEIRKVIYTTNPIESVNSALRKVTRGKGSFPSENAVLKVMFLRIRDLEKKWTKPIAHYSIIIQQLIKLFGERITKYLEI